MEETMADWEEHKTLDWEVYSVEGHRKGTGTASVHNPTGLGVTIVTLCRVRL